MTDQKQTTHVVTTPNKKPPTDIEVLRDNIRSVEFTKTITGYFTGNDTEAERFKIAVIDYVRRVPKLLTCDRISLMSAFAQVAFFKFMPSGVSGEAYIIPYGNEAKFQLGYQGLVTLLYRTGKIKAITSNIIYANDVFEYEEGLEAKLVHKPAMFGKDKGEAIGVYTIAHLAGGQKTFKVMDMAGVMGIKELSKAKGSKDSPWNSNQDPEKWMWKKTCLIQHSKLLPRTQDVQKAIEEDFKGEGMEKYTLDAGGPAVGASSHKPAEFTEADKAAILEQESKEAEGQDIEM